LCWIRRTHHSRPSLPPHTRYHDVHDVHDVHDGHDAANNDHQGTGAHHHSRPVGHDDESYPHATASADDERCAGTTTSTVTTPDYTVPGYVPPLPDAAGNPPCPLPSIWNTAVSGAGISVFASRDPTAVTVTVRKKSGVDESQSATIKPGQSLHQFDFPRVDKSSVAEVLAFSVNDGSRCYVTVF